MFLIKLKESDEGILIHGMGIGLPIHHVYEAGPRFVHIMNGNFIKSTLRTR